MHPYLSLNLFCSPFFVCLCFSFLVHVTLVHSKHRQAQLPYCNYAYFCFAFWFSPAGLGYHYHFILNILLLYSHLNFVPAAFVDLLCIFVLFDNVFKFQSLFLLMGFFFNIAEKCDCVSNMLLCLYIC